MVKSRHRIRTWYPSTQLLGLVVGGACLVALRPSFAEFNDSTRPDDVSTSMLVAEEVSWLPGEERTPGVFPNAAPDPLGAAKLHYVDTMGEERTSVLVYMEPATAKRGIKRNEVRALTARAGGHVHYEYDVVGSQNAGLRPIYLSRHHDGNHTGIPRFYRYSELLNVLETAAQEN